MATRRERTACFIEKSRPQEVFDTEELEHSKPDISSAR